jgi:type I restriction enzyme R subunit
MTPPDDQSTEPPDDPEGDGTVIVDPVEPTFPPQDPFGGDESGGRSGPQKKIYVDGVGASIIRERVEYLDADGKLVTESLKDFTRRHLTRHFASTDDFLRRWNNEDRKQAILEELAEEGLDITLIGEELGRDLDPFDLICHVAFDAKPLTRRERAENVKKRDVFNKYGEQARAVLEALLEKYADEGVLTLDDTNILQINPFSHMGTPVELMRSFGKKHDYLQAVHDLQNALYYESA